MKKVRLSIAEAFSKCPTTIDTEHAWTLWQLTLTGRNLKLRFFPRLCLICGHLFNNYLVLDSGVETVIKRSHVLERQQLDVKPYYPFPENWTTNKTDIAQFWSRSVWLCQEVPPTRITRTEGTGWIFRWRSKFYNHYFSIGEEGEKESLQSWQKRVSGLETFLPPPG